MLTSFIHVDVQIYPQAYNIKVQKAHQYWLKFILKYIIWNKVKNDAHYSYNVEVRVKVTFQPTYCMDAM